MNKKLFLRLAVIILAQILGACGLGHDKDESDSPARQLFAKHCIACHGANGEGKQVSGQLIPSLKTGRAMTDSDELMRQQIQRGGRGMPPFDYQMTPEQVGELVRYIRQVQSRPK